MWKSRCSQETNGKIQRFSQSLDLDWRLALWDIRGRLVYAEMLNQKGLITDSDLSAIRRGFQDILDELDRGEFVPGEDLADVHMNLEHRLTEKIGVAGAYLHSRLNRNDHEEAAMRLYVKDVLAQVRDGLIRLLEALLDRAEIHHKTIVPGYTHLQQSQPVSMGHFWMAYFEAFSRDIGRLEFALEVSDECPLGCGALAGSTMPLDREYMTQALGFERPSQNSMDAVGQRDYVFDVLSFASIFSVHCSRLAEDLILYASAEFGWVILPGGFSAGSRMMPQNKNTDALELVRGRTGRMVGHLVDFLVTLKGLPMTYNWDLQEEKRNLFSAFDALLPLLDVLPELISAVELDADRAAESFSDGLALATDVVEYLVLKGIPFREAHQRVDALVGWCIREGRSLFDLDLDEFQVFLAEDAQEDLLSLVDLEAAVARRETLGGTGFKQVRRQIQRGVDLILSLRETGTVS
ncbi:MAG: argininosuccinate lyase [Dethiosulfovibrio peptidovorans]|nr:MAG: argininosuccinate lyase [Dethiosulfovibrio peptidovorans]